MAVKKDEEERKAEKKGDGENCYNHLMCKGDRLLRDEITCSNCCRGSRCRSSGISVYRIQPEQEKRAELPDKWTEVEPSTTVRPISAHTEMPIVASTPLSPAFH